MISLNEIVVMFYVLWFSSTTTISGLQGTQYILFKFTLDEKRVNMGGIDTFHFFECIRYLSKLSLKRHS